MRTPTSGSGTARVGSGSLPEPAAILAEQLAQTQELIKSHYKQNLTAARKQQQIIGGLRKENDDLRAQLDAAENLRKLGSTFSGRKNGDLPSQLCAGENDWTMESTCSGTSAEHQAPEARPMGWLSPEPPTLVMELDSTPGSPRTSLPGTVDRAQMGRPAAMDTSKGLSRQRKGSLSTTSSVPDVPHSPLGLPNRARKLPEIFMWAAQASDEEGSAKLGNANPLKPGAEALKESVQRSLFKPEYHVFDFYKETGIAQTIARSLLFENLTLVVIFLNAVWIAVDSDLNHEPVLFDAEIVFQVAEYFFFAYFFFEWTVRFLAFKCKRNCFRDGWFNFDTFLMILMIFDSWILQIVITTTGTTKASHIASVPVFRILRLLRLTRMMRMYRLLQKAPELMILIKGIAGAMRSVGFALVLLSGVIYIFAIVFTTLTQGTEIGSLYFSTVPRAATTLLLDGTLPDLAGIVYSVSDEHIAYGILFTLFILIASLTIMNLLVGVLVEVVSTVSLVEKEQMEVTFLKGHMLQLLPCLDQDGDMMISKEEFAQLMEKPKAIKALREVGVDVVGLAELSDFIYKDADELNFPDFMDTVLSLRSTNTATVKSIVDTRKFITTELARIEDNLLGKLHQIITMDFNKAVARTLKESARCGRL